MIRYKPSRVYSAIFCVEGKLFRRSLETTCAATRTGRQECPMPLTFGTPHPGGLNKNSLRFTSGTGGQRMPSFLTRLFHRGAKGIVYGVPVLGGETGFRHESASVSNRLQGPTRCRLKPGLHAPHQAHVCSRTVNSLGRPTESWPDRIMGNQNRIRAGGPQLASPYESSIYDSVSP